MWPTYHLHTTFCDGKNSVSEWVAHLLACGVPSAGLSSHAPLPPAIQRPWAMNSSALENYLKEIRLAAQASRLQLYTGLEVDFVAGVTGPARFAHLVDYTIGSIHILGVLENGSPWEVDMSRAQFTQGVQERFDMNYQKAVEAYFQAVREMISLSTPTAVGHLDKIKIHNRPLPLFDETAPWYREQAFETLRAIQNNGVILEVNTRGRYQNKTDSAYPSDWILREAMNLKIPITLSSDAHRVEELHNAFAETAAWLNAMGYNKIMVLKDHAWVPVPFSETGVVWT